MVTIELKDGTKKEYIDGIVSQIQINKLDIRLTRTPDKDIPADKSRLSTATVIDFDKSQTFESIPLYTVKKFTFEPYNVV